MISYSSSSTFIFYVLYLPCALLALSNLFMAQHTDPGAIPLGARPLRIYDDGNGFNDAVNGEGGASGGAGGDCSKSETSSVASSLLDGIDGSQVMAHGHGNSNDAGRKKGVRRCRKCRNNYKPPRAHHDSVTGRCVSKFDHFCPWVGNAVGAMNHKFFVLFIFYTFLCSAISLALIIMRFVRCGYTTPDSDANTNMNTKAFNFDAGNTNTSGMEQNWLNGTSNASDIGAGMRFLEDDNHQTYLYQGCEDIYTMQVLSLMIVSIIFLVFTFCMLFEQVDAIESNTSKIARMKMRMGQDDGEYGKVADGFNEMFGVGIGSQGAHVGLHWFLPTPVTFPTEHDRNRVLGFEYSKEWSGSVYDEDEEEGGYDSRPQTGGLRGGDAKQFNGHRQRSGSLMISDDEFTASKTIMEIELPSKDGLRLGQSSGTINRRSSTAHADGDSLSEHSAKIV